MARSREPLLSAYLAVGTDELKAGRVVQRLKAYLPPESLAFNLDEREVTPALDADSLISSLETLPLGSPLRVVILTHGERLTRELRDALADYLKNPNPSTTLCLVAEKLDGRSPLYKAFKAMDPKAVIDCAPVKRWELPRQVIRMARGYGMQMDEGAAEALVERVGQSTAMLDGQLRTLSELCRGKSTISVDDVVENVARIQEPKPWTFVDAICERNAAEALGQYFLMDNPSQIALTAFIAMRIRELVCAKSLVARGEGPALANELGKKSWQVKNHVRWAGHFKEGELEAILARCARTERELKGGANPDMCLVSLVAFCCSGTG